MWRVICHWTGVVSTRILAGCRLDALHALLDDRHHQLLELGAGVVSLFELVDEGLNVLSLINCLHLLELSKKLMGFRVSLIKLTVVILEVFDSLMIGKAEVRTRLSSDELSHVRQFSLHIDML
jgi:hypothetical protein